MRKAKVENAKAPVDPFKPLSCELKRGSVGGAVVVLQRQLNAVHADSLLVEDGVFGKDTEVSVCAWQRLRGLPEDGVIHSGTWILLAEGNITGSNGKNRDEVSDD